MPGAIVAAGEDHEQFTKWALRQGVSINKVAAARFADRGMGIVATEKIQEGDVLTSVPISALITVSSVPAQLKKAIGPVTVHGLLAAALCFNAKQQQRQPSWQAWRRVWPSKEEFLDGLPILWSPELQRMLPFAAAELLQKQQQKFVKDFSAVSPAMADISEDEYRYYWLIVNTRSFYYVKPGTRKTPPRDDCMALCPFSDYFNHADAGVCSNVVWRRFRCFADFSECPVTFGPDGFTVTSDRSYEPGEEVYLSYGNHSNDFLLTEYGFILDRNRWDEIRLDDLILRQISEKQKAVLRDAMFLGNYVLDQIAVCYRTEVALKLIMLPENEWDRFSIEDEDESGSSDRIGKLCETLMSLEEQARGYLRILNDQDNEIAGGSMLQKRWHQVIHMLEKARDRYKKDLKQH
ncbi:MAG: hypothetical protein M1837_007207 [Sclerophora amabilis]|nr:MAG: hypothetical protein M1837_007207 [Sclerophora amabilis]